MAGAVDPHRHAIGLFIPVLSYNGHLTISFASCREMVPDPDYLADCFVESFDELVSEAETVLARQASA